MVSYFNEKIGNTWLLQPNNDGNKENIVIVVIED